MKRIRKIFFIIPVFFIACSTKTPQPQNKNNYIKDIKTIKQQEKKRLQKILEGKEPYKFTIKPIVGSEQDDAKVVVDMGKVLKIWIAPYVVHNTLIAAHSLYTWVQAPKFIPGESVPRPTDSDGLITPTGNFPVIYRPSEFDNVTPKYTNKEIKEYVNKVYEVENNSNEAVSKEKKKIKKYDETIKKYLKEKNE